VHKDVLVVPEGAILMTPSGRSCDFREKGGAHVAKIARVKLGLRSRGMVEIIPLDAPCAKGKRRRVGHGGDSDFSGRETRSSAAAQSCR